MRFVTAFFRFWYDFLVGDSVALAIGGVLVLSIGYLLAETGISRSAQLILPIVVMGTVIVSLPRLPKG